MTERLVVLTETQLRELVRDVVDETLRRLPANDEILDTEAAAALIKVHPKTLARRARLGQVPAERVGHEWRFRRSLLF